MTLERVSFAQRVAAVPCQHTLLCCLRIRRQLVQVSPREKVVAAERVAASVRSSAACMTMDNVIHGQSNLWAQTKCYYGIEGCRSGLPGHAPLLPARQETIRYKVQSVSVPGRQLCCMEGCCSAPHTHSTHLCKLAAADGRRLLDQLLLSKFGLSLDNGSTLSHTIHHLTFPHTPHTCANSRPLIGRKLGQMQIINISLPPSAITLHCPTHSTHLCKLAAAHGRRQLRQLLLADAAPLHKQQHRRQRRPAPPQLYQLILVQVSKHAPRPAAVRCAAL